MRRRVFNIISAASLVLSALVGGMMAYCTIGERMFCLWEERSSSSYNTRQWIGLVDNGLLFSESWIPNGPGIAAAYRKFLGFSWQQGMVSGVTPAAAIVVCVVPYWFLLTLTGALPCWWMYRRYWGGRERRGFPIEVRAGEE